MIDRSEELEELIKKYKEEIKSAPELRNRNEPLKRAVELEEPKAELFNFSRGFLSECTLTNATLMNLKSKVTKLSQKSEQISFSFTASPSGNNLMKELEDALNICSMNLSILKKKLQDFCSASFAENLKSKSFSFFRHKTEAFTGESAVLEHCRLVLSFLEARVGLLTEELEAYKTRRKNRENLLRKSETKYMDNKYKSEQRLSLSSSSPSSSYSTASSTIDSSIGESSQMSQLQVENNQMLEEMSRGLFETLSSTESQVLEIARLQSTLQSHLTIQHDLTCRLFDDSILTVEETRKGNEYLRRSGKDGSMMRKFLVGLILGMSFLLLMLHYFNS